MTEWMTTQEAMAYLKVSRATLYSWCASGTLRFFELESGGGRRFRREDLDGTLKAGSPTVAAEDLSNEEQIRRLDARRAIELNEELRTPSKFRDL